MPRQYYEEYESPEERERAEQERTEAERRARDRAGNEARRDRYEEANPRDEEHGFYDISDEDREYLEGRYRREDTDGDGIYDSSPRERETQEQNDYYDRLRDEQAATRANQERWNEQRPDNRYSTRYDEDSAWLSDQGLPPEEQGQGPTTGNAELDAFLGFANDEAEKGRAVWRDLAGTAPTVDDLTADTYLESNTDAYGDMLGGPSAFENFGTSGDQQSAMSAMQRMYLDGGYTAADEAQRRLAAMQRQQMLGAQNAAAIQQANARGMGGGGQELAARLSASQGLNQGQAMADASIQGAAMDRAMQALQGFGSMANTAQGQELSRRAQLDAYNQANLDWRRGQEQRNTAWMNRGAESRANANQQAYQNRENIASGYDRQYQGEAAGRRQDQQRGDQWAQAGLGAVGELLDW